MRIAKAIGEKENAKGIITGDSVGQVASQTLENLGCINESVRSLVISPLIGLNKEDIIKMSKDIGTYELSILPYPDCCSFMIAKHPETRADIETIRKAEKGIKNQNEKIIPKK